MNSSTGTMLVGFIIMEAITFALLICQNNFARQLRNQGVIFIFIIIDRPIQRYEKRIIPKII